MNLFYLLGTNEFLVDSDLNISNSIINTAKTDGVCLYPYILAFRDYGGDGVLRSTLDLSSFSISTDESDFKYYSDFVLVNNECNFIGCESYDFTPIKILSTISVDNANYSPYPVLDTVTWTGITYGNGIYCIVGISGLNEITIGTSNDKITWAYNTITTTWVTNNPKISFGNNSFIVADASIYKSTTGTSWSMIYDDPTWGWDDIQFSNKGFITYNRNAFYCGISIDGITWSTQTLPSIIGTDATLAYWKNIESNGDILCMKTSPDIVDSTTGMSSITFSTDGGLSWMTQTLLDGANQGIVSLSVPKFWEHFTKTTES